MVTRYNKIGRIPTYCLLEKCGQLVLPDQPRGHTPAGAAAAARAPATAVTSYAPTRSVSDSAPEA